MKVLFKKAKTYMKSRDPGSELPTVNPRRCDEEPLDNVHATRAGAFPEKVPQPSKIPVLLFYISCICCVLGTIMIVQSFFNVHDDSKQTVLTVGCTIVLVGLVLAFIMNVLNKREHDAFVSYVYNKALEMRNDPSSRQRFNENFENHPPGSQGPYGLR